MNKHINKQLIRLLVAAVISASTWGGTYYWYHSTKKKNSVNENEKALAYVGEVQDEIQRRPAARLLWQEVKTGESLYNGEAIRTSEKGEVRIIFSDSDRFIDLEPESLIVIKKSSGEIALDLMEGSLFVNAQNNQNANAPNLVLNSEAGKVDLSKAKASLSKTKGQDVNVQVLEGKASLKNSSGETKELIQGSSASINNAGFQFNKNNLKILAPHLHKPIYIYPSESQSVAFKWSGFPPNTLISLWIGSTRKDLKQIAQTKAINMDTLLAQLPLGKQYWKLIAIDEKNPKNAVESNIFKSEVVMQYAPTMVFPLPNAIIDPPRLPYDLTFKWQTTENVKNIILEIWADSQLKNKIIQKQFKTEESFLLPSLNEGTYYWRMTSYFENSAKSISSKIQNFRISQKVETMIPVNVQWTLNESDKTQYFIEQPSLNLKWSASDPKKVAQWKLKYFDISNQEASTQEITVNTTDYKAPLDKPGRYIASVEALDSQGRLIGKASPTEINVSPRPLLTTPRFTNTEPQIKASDSGHSEVSWKKVDGAKEYWLTILKEGKEIKKEKSATTMTQLKNLMPGEYKIELQAIDEYGRTSEGMDTKMLLVPNNSGLKAPTLKKIKVN